jgi:hypothetical protein
MISPAHPMQLALGLIVWTVFFVALYAGLSVGCAVAPPDEAQGPLTWINGALLALTLLTTVVLLRWSWKCWRARRDSTGAQGTFLPAMGAAVHLIAAAATLAIAAPVLVLPPCV